MAALLSSESVRKQLQPILEKYLTVENAKQVWDPHGGRSLVICEYPWIKPEDVKILAGALGSGHFPLLSLHLSVLGSGQLQSLAISDNGIGNEGAKSLAEALGSGQCTLQSLNISYNEIRNEGAKSLAEALGSGQCTLQSLAISDNGIRNEGAKSLAEALGRGQCTLQSLAISYNWIGSEGAKSLAEALGSGQCTLQSLDISHNGIGDEGAKSLAEALGSEQSTLISLNLSIEYDGLASLAGALRSKHCKLERLRIEGRFRDERMLQILHALKFNFKLKELDYKWKSDLLRNEAKNLLERNKLFSSTGLAKQEKAPPNTAKLFICGDPRVGKTTIRKNLVKNHVFLTCHSASRSTIGMDLSALKFGNKHLQICDLAGQQEFHAFHHLFLKGSDKDLFLIVCKAPTATFDRAHPQFELTLKYWLRFIASHCSPSSEIKPRVFVALNYFEADDINMNEDAYTLLHDHLRAYSNFLDFGDLKHSIFGFVAKDPIQLKPLKHQLNAALANLLDQRPQIPEICAHIIDKIRKARDKTSFFPWRHHYPKVTSFEEFVNLLPANFMVKHEISKGLLGDALGHLCDMGELVYFNETKEFIILNVQWFVREVIGVFMRPEYGAAEQRYCFQLSEIQRKLKLLSNQDYSDAIIGCLEKLGVLYKFEDEQSHVFVLVPALLTQQLGGWPKEGRNGDSYIGRRYSCANKEHTLLPSGVFTKLQVRLKKLHPNPYHVGDGWVSFTTLNDINFIIKIGGEKELWTDRHWIDVMLRVPFDSDDLIECSKLAAHEFCKIREEVLSISCVSLDEYVIRPESVQNLQVDLNHDVVLLDEIKKKAREMGPSCSHNWSSDHHTGISKTAVSKLMFSSELYDLVKQQNEDLEEIYIEIESLESGEDQKKVLRMQSLRRESFKRNFSRATELVDPDDKLAPDMEMLLERLRLLFEGQKEILEGQKKILEGHREILKGLDQVRNLVEKMANKVLQKLALVMEVSATTMPCLPYFVGRNNCIQKVTGLLGKEGLLGNSFQLHLSCESKFGCHHNVRDQKGIKVTIPANWMVKFSKIMAPALTCLVLIARVALTVAVDVSLGVPRFASDVSNMIAENKSIQDIVKNMLDLETTSPCDMLGKSVNDDELRMFFSSLVEKKELDMKSDFGLYHVLLEDKTAWVCQHHKQQYINHGGKHLHHPKLCF